ncbi:MAG: RnfABCDGE type electron transport complex subunit D [Candidatus Thermoplasmatota archaeon]|nr:RnfABCDGE type electron transport complex subunit D [Euryarchaeota archaeon]MBU4033050.1 RnfABCDGE type electron transport complex subunit D [Candidatus Thermoplasmatota archaeon]MBU4071113.1 RnfABCDGE type electron transport complex subunit D [Candidatus Thermoplasmatota archaeon]MBU4143695.1 RnfABCDGE type electron transport complex subunit D [Candidatus Thermoplasmatota archaeon]MBU4591791.1 RnfABCDGE type electron transport complex subunit D [Candidatus Thermoplasmatota archaeon]
MNATDDSQQPEKRLFRVMSGPHLRSPRSIDKAMFMVILMLMLPAIGAIYYFGIYVLFIILTAILSAVITEYVAKRLRKRKFYFDGSAVLTGLLLAMVLPPRVPLWMVVIGAAFSIAIVKEAFGGLGHNIFNPALAGRAFLTVSFTGLMTRWVLPITTGNDAVAGASPLSGSFVWEGPTQELYRALLFGNVGGSLGETSALLILIGGLILLIIGIINWRIPVFYIGTVFLFTWLLPGQDPVFHILAGGLFLGAFFMATDYVTVPLTNTGKMIFAASCGFLTVAIRVYGGMPEGVAFSILIMNGFTPLIDRYTVPKPLGYMKPKPKEKEKKSKDAPEKGDTA